MKTKSPGNHSVYNSNPYWVSLRGLLRTMDRELKYPILSLKICYED